MAARVRLLANPSSGRGRGARLLPQARAALESAGLGTDVVFTNQQGDEVRLARQAVADGIETLVVLGGDGTWSQAARGVVEAGGGDRCRLALLAGGTGNDLAKSIGAPAADFGLTARLIAEGRERRIDAASAAGHMFFNSAGFGFDAAVLERAQRPGVLRGSAVYVASAMRELFGYGGLLVRVNDEPEQRRLMLVFANGQWFGGTFRIAPDARPDDGALDMVAIPDAGPAARVRLFVSVMRGRHPGLSAVQYRREPRFRLHFDAPPAAQLDGELLRIEQRDMEVRSLPGAIRVVAGE